MDTLKIVRLKRYKEVSSPIDMLKTQFLSKKEKVVDSDALWITPERDPQILDNRFAVVHTLHNTTAILGIEWKRRNRNQLLMGKNNCRYWGIIVDVHHP